MAWWRRLFEWKARSSSLDSLEFHVAFRAYSEDGKREVEVREFSNGETYVVEREWTEGAFEDRHGGRMVGPFPSPSAAETFSVATRWFTGSEP